MLLDAIRIRRPELRPEILQLIELIAHAEQRGQPQILPVEELVRMLGVRVSEELHEQLAARGDLVFEEHRFHNAGPLISRQSRLFGFSVEMEISDQLDGAIRRFPGSFQLFFAEGRSFCFRKFLFQIELRHLDVSSDRIYIDFAGGQDVFIELS
jgi:hypothetical protein